MKLAEWKEKIIDFIQKIDPNHEIISHIDNDKIEYNHNFIKRHRNLTKPINEEYVRAYLTVKLIKNYGYDKTFNIELEKEYGAGKNPRNKPRVDIIVRDFRKTENKNAFMMIEVKTPEEYEHDKKYIKGQLFDTALLEQGNGPISYLTYYTIDADDLADQSMIINYKKYNSFELWEQSGFLTVDAIPRNYGIAIKKTYVNKEDIDLRDEEKNLDTKVKKDTFNYIRQDLHNVLYSGGEMFYNDIFSNLIRLFLAKIYDEEQAKPGEPYEFQIFYHNEEPEDTDNTFKRINNLFKISQKMYLGYTEKMLEETVGIDREKIAPNKVAYVVEKLQGISITKNENKQNGDLLGEFFEGIVSHGFRQTRGQFFTHQNLVRFIIEVLDIPGYAVKLLKGDANISQNRLPYICDPSCGSGTFLIESMLAITKQLKAIDQKTLAIKARQILGAYSPELTPNIWAREYLYGIERNADLALSSKVNMVLHGDGFVNIFAENGLSKFDKYVSLYKQSMLLTSVKKSIEDIVDNRHKIEEYQMNEQFDFVLSNPPFSMDLDTATLREITGYLLFADKQNSENLFIERWYQLLRPNGRLGVILPDSVFNSDDNLYIRIFLFRFFEIKSVVSLTMEAFKPYTPTKTSILFARKKTVNEVEKFDKEWERLRNDFRHLKIEILKRLDLNEIEELNELFGKLLSGIISDKIIDKGPNYLIESEMDTINNILNNEVWWIFNNISKQFNYTIYMAHADNIGYKRSKKRGELLQPNDLFDSSKTNYPIWVKDGKKILDFIKQNNIWGY